MENKRLFNKTDGAMLIYYIGLCIISILIRMYIFPNYIPANITIFISLFVIAIGTIISYLEVKGNKNIFYSWGNNWNGLAFANSSLIYGVAIFIVTSDFIKGIAYSIVTAMIWTITRIAFRKIKH
ncbi:MAG: hypothetical protein R3Y58_09145 [Eubacteriales bacterium]